MCDRLLGEETLCRAAILCSTFNSFITASTFLVFITKKILCLESFILFIFAVLVSFLYEKPWCYITGHLNNKIIWKNGYHMHQSQQTFFSMTLQRLFFWWGLMLKNACLPLHLLSLIFSSYAVIVTKTLWMRLLEMFRVSFLLPHERIGFLQQSCDESQHLYPFVKALVHTKTIWKNLIS